MKCTNITKNLKKAVDFYVDQDGLSETEAQKLVQECEDPYFQEIVESLSKDEIPSTERLQISGLADKEQLEKLFGRDGTTPLLRRLQFFKEHETSDLQKLSAQHADAIWIHKALVLEDGLNLRFFPEVMREKKEVIYAALYQNPKAFIHFSQKLKNDINYVRKLIQDRPQIFPHLEESMKYDSEILCIVMEKAPKMLSDVLPYIKDDRRAGLLAIAIDPSVTKDLAALKENRKFIYEAVHSSPRILEHISEDTLSDLDFVFTLIKVNPQTVKYLPDHLRENADFIVKCLQEGAGPALLKYVDPDLLEDFEFALRAAKAEPWAYQYFDKDVQNSRDILLVAVTRNGGVIQFAPKQFLSDRELAIATVRSAGWSLQFFDIAIRSDAQIVELAVQQDGIALRYAIEMFRDDKRLALLAVSKSGLALQDLSLRLRRDLDVILIAVRQYPRGIRAVPEDIQTDIIQRPDIQKLLFDTNITLITHPNLLSADLKERYGYLTAMSREFDIPVHKFDTNELEALIHNRTHLDETDSRPLAVIFDPDPHTDEDKVFNFPSITSQLFKSHRVVYFRIQSTGELTTFFHEATKVKKASFLTIGGHGLPQSLLLGDTGGWDERRLDVSDSEVLAAMEQGLATDAQIFFLSCSLFNIFVRESFGRMTSRVWKDRELLGFNTPETPWAVDIKGTRTDGRLAIEATHNNSIVKCVNGVCEIVK